MNEPKDMNIEKFANEIGTKSRTEEERMKRKEEIWDAKQGKKKWKGKNKREKKAKKKEEKSREDERREEQRWEEKWGEEKKREG